MLTANFFIVNIAHLSNQTVAVRSNAVCLSQDPNNIWW